MSWYYIFQYEPRMGERANYSVIAVDETGVHLRKLSDTTRDDYNKEIVPYLERTLEQKLGGLKLQTRASLDERAKHQNDCEFTNTHCTLAHASTLSAKDLVDEVALHALGPKL